MLFCLLNLSFTVIMHDHSLLLTLSTTMHSHLRMLSVSHDGSRQPSPGLHLAQKTLQNSKRECSSFLPENVQIWVVTSLHSFHNSQRKFPVGPRNCTIQFAGCMSLLTKIAHCVVSVLNRLGWTVHCAFLAVSQPPDNPKYALGIFGSQPLDLPA